jgi:hypothetical protein
MPLKCLCCVSAVSLLRFLLVLFAVSTDKQKLAITRLHIIICNYLLTCLPPFPRERSYNVHSVRRDCTSMQEIDAEL